MSNSSSNNHLPKGVTKEEYNDARRKHIYPKESEVTGGPMNFIRVHSPEPMIPRGRILHEWTKCEKKGKGGCRSGRLGWFVQLEDGRIKHAMMMMGRECGETEDGEGEGEKGGEEGGEQAEEEREASAT